ncbi:galactose oxidase [Aulographum hederae CBS 113979]|uniref:Galactose oxidase n=1 Tax=Aulographum hederae CBS 113979 TaxID=1176131 RepID=A0A6G1H4Y5_9PEZI|nr:galactose oxidase [Aulographum hederae CBS 113979]
MAKAKDKKKAAEKKARKTTAQEKKTDKKGKKTTAKNAADDSDAESVDLDAVLAEYAKQQEQFLKVTETTCDPPSHRASSTLIGSPANDNELFLFGGEYYNGSTANFYNDLFIYNTHRDEWRQVTSPNSPLPRSGHAWTRGGNAGGVYLFGGEFSSPKQGTFYHYNDFWHLDPRAREWTRLESKGKGPPARSGHRMTYFKNYIVLFGGFQDTSMVTKYLQDVWVYDCTSFTWHSPVLPPAGQKPDARSSFSFLPHESGAMLYGGYSRVKTSASAGNRGKGGAGPATRMILKPVVHQDCWLLRIVPPPPDSPPNALPKVHWERRKRAANAPNPARAGATMAYHKGRGIQFGGVHDVEESEEGIESEFFNNLFAWNVERNRYFPLTLRRPRAPKKVAQEAKSKRGRGKADEEELLENLRQLEMKGKLDAEGDDENLPNEKEEDMEERPEKPTMFEMPHPRFNAQLTVQDDVLYIFGGTFEKGDREYTFDEMYAIDLGKLDGVKEIYHREIEDWQGSEDEGSDDDDEDDEDDDDEEEDEDSVSAEPNTAQPSIPATSTDSKSTDPEPDDSCTTTSSALTDDGLPHPRPFETLREFYTRTNNPWQEIILDQLARTYGGDGKSVKEIKKAAFERAEEKWWDCREEVRALEDEQNEAGIGEVVSLAERGKGEGGGGTAGGVVGRRR